MSSLVKLSNKFVPMSLGEMFKNADISAVEYVVIIVIKPLSQDQTGDLG